MWRKNHSGSRQEKTTSNCCELQACFLKNPAARSELFCQRHNCENDPGTQLRLHKQTACALPDSFQSGCLLAGWVWESQMKVRPKECISKCIVSISCPFNILAGPDFDTIANCTNPTSNLILGHLSLHIRQGVNASWTPVALLIGFCKTAQPAGFVSTFRRFSSPDSHFCFHTTFV